MKQARSFKTKLEIARNNIAEFYEYFDGKVYVAFSGGKDSTAVLHMVREMYPDVRACFYNTGLEFPEVVRFVKKHDNVDFMRPKIPFHKIVDKFGYPVISKEVAHYISVYRKSKAKYCRQDILFGGRRFNLPKKYRFLLDAPFKIGADCCKIMKKNPAKLYHKQSGHYPIVALMAADSRLRMDSWKRYGCNAFKLKFTMVRPIMSWTTEDVGESLRRYDVPYCCLYDRGWERTGCMFCAFGLHREPQPNAFQRMKKTHPRHYDYVINRLGFGPVLKWLGIPYE